MTGESSHLEVECRGPDAGRTAHSTNFKLNLALDLVMPQNPIAEYCA